MIKDSYKSFLRNYFLTEFFYDLIFAYAIYTVLFSIKGLSILQISILLWIWGILAMIFEIPTGALADSWSRKHLMTIAPLVKALCFVAWFFADGNFYLYALGFGLWALGSSLVSGTSESYLYDGVNHFNKADEYEKAISKKHSYYYIGLAIASISGGFIAHYNINWAVIFSVIPLLLSAYFASLLPEIPKLKSTEEIHYFDYIKIAFKEIRTNRVLLYLTVYVLSLSTIFGSLEEFDQLYYQLVHLPIIAFGIVGFIGSISSAAGTYFAHRFKKHASIFFVLPAISALLLILVAKFPSIPMIAVLLATYFLVSPLNVLLESRIQHNIESVSRATVTSIISFLLNLGIITLIFGLLSRFWGLQSIYLSAGIFLLIFSIGVFSVRNRLTAKRAYGHLI